METSKELNSVRAILGECITSRADKAIEMDVNTSSTFCLHQNIELILKVRI